MQKYQENVADKTGRVVVGATVTVTLASTGLPATLYSDNGVTVMQQPLTTAALGFFYFYAADDRYNIEIAKSGYPTLIRTDILLEDVSDDLLTHATREQAQDGLSDQVISSPLNVAQQLAATLPPDCRVLQFGMADLGPATTTSSTTVPMGDSVSIFPRSDSSRLLVFATWGVNLTAPATDTLIRALSYLRYYDGSDYVGFLEVQDVAVGGATSVDIRIHAPVTFVGVLTASQKSSTGTSRWQMRPYMQSVSGATISMIAGRLVYVEIDDADSTSASESVEELIHMVSYGQSLGAGSQATPIKTTTAVRAGRALMPVAGVRPLGVQSSAQVNDAVTATQIKALVDLFEDEDAPYGETPSSSAAYMMTAANGVASQAAVVVYNHSIGGVTIAALSSGSVPYANILATVARSRVLARRNGLSHSAGGLWFTHGESNRSNTQAQYLAALVALQASLTADIRAIDRLTGEFPVFLDQLHSFEVTDVTIPLAQLQAALDYPGKFYLVCPKYMLQTVVDGTHLTADASAWLGSYQGEIARRVLADGEAWLPTHITSAVRSGASVVLTYHVPDGSLEFDTTLVTDPGNKGFRWIQTGGNVVTINDVTITASDQITLTLSDIPTGTDQKVGYADIGEIGAAGGPLTGPRGNVRDQATATGLYGETLYNWAAVQQKAVTV